MLIFAGWKTDENLIMGNDNDKTEKKVETLNNGNRESCLAGVKHHCIPEIETWSRLFIEAVKKQIALIAGFVGYVIDIIG